jgi:MATE family multidrug resistance protein
MPQFLVIKHGGKRPACSCRSITTSRAVTEFLALCALSVPVALTTLCRTAVYTTDIAYLGHLGVNQLSGAGLANAWMQFGGVFVWSSAYALNSVCSQAIGAGNPKLAGIWLQLALGMVVALSIPAIAAHFWTGEVRSAWINLRKGEAVSCDSLCADF